MATTTDHEYLTIAEAAALVRVDRSTIRRWIASGKLHALRPGERTVRINRSELASQLGHVNDFDPGRADSEDAAPRLSRSIDAATKQRMLEAVERFKLLQAEQVATIGAFDTPSWELLHEAREERGRQLMGDE